MKEETAIGFGYDRENNEMNNCDCDFYKRYDLKKVPFAIAMKLLKGKGSTSKINPAVEIDGEFYTKADLIEKLEETVHIMDERLVFKKALKLFPSEKRGRERPPKK